MYNNLMHVSDWFPTLLEMAEIKYIPRLGYELDGVSHYAAWLSMSGRSLTGGRSFGGGRSLGGQSLRRSLTGGSGSVVIPPPRTTMLYNAATNVDKQDFDYSTNAPFAVRNERYKLIHFFNSTGVKTHPTLPIRSSITSSKPTFTTHSHYTSLQHTLTLQVNTLL